jgi:hypothetical protein
VFPLGRGGPFGAGMIWAGCTAARSGRGCRASGRFARVERRDQLGLPLSGLLETSQHRALAVLGLANLCEGIILGEGFMARGQRAQLTVSEGFALKVLPQPRERVA